MAENYSQRKFKLSRSASYIIFNPLSHCLDVATRISLFSEAQSSSSILELHIGLLRQGINTVSWECLFDVIVAKPCVPAPVIGGHVAEEVYS